MAGGSIAVVDLSVSLESRMTVFPGDPEVEITPALTIGRDGVNVLALHLGSQSGTHVDAPYHVIEGGSRLDDLPLDRFLGPALVADVRGVGPEAPITLADLEPVLGTLRPGAILLLRTGWWRHVQDYERYRRHPWLSVEAAHAVVASGVRTVGIDALNIDATPADLSTIRFDAHLPILGADGVIVENLSNLDAIDRLRDPVVSVLPLKLSGSDGAPVRAVAFERDALSLL
jgi:kynurenine formamidase